MSEPCPCCGRLLPDMDDVIIDPSGIVVSRGRYVRLTANEFGVLQLLHQRMPRVLTKQALLSSLYQLRPDDPPEIKIVDVWICKLRKKLKPLGINIDTVWGQGYRMLPASPRSEAA